MPTRTIEYTTESERIELERAIAYVQEMRRVGATAAHGIVLDTCGTFAPDAGRRLLRNNLAAPVQTRAGAEKKSPAGRPKGDKSQR
jgi:hypothetical protein